MFGYVDDASFLPDLLSGGKVAPGRAMAELADSVAVENTGSFGTYTAWLDAKHGFLPRRIEVQKRGNDKLGKEIVGKIPPVRPGEMWPSSQFNEYRQLVGLLGTNPNNARDDGGRESI